MYTLLGLVVHHALDIGELLIKVGTSHIEMFVPDIGEDCILRSKHELGATVFLVVEFFAHLFIWVNDSVSYLYCSRLDAKELI